MNATNIFNEVAHTQCLAGLAHNVVIAFCQEFESNLLFLCTPTVTLQWDACKMISVIWQLQSGSDDRWLGGCIKMTEVAEMTVCLSIACNSTHDSGSS